METVELDIIQSAVSIS